LKTILFRLVLRLRGIIVAPPIMVQSKKCSPKSYYLCITNNEILKIQNRSQKNAHSCVPLNDSFSNKFWTVVRKLLGINVFKKGQNVDIYPSNRRAKTIAWIRRPRIRHYEGERDHVETFLAKRLYTFLGLE